MKRNSSRYRETGIEGEWQPGSEKRVLRNLKGVARKTEMDRVEADALLVVEEQYLEKITPESQFTANRICQMHKDWLGGIYEWAGHYRTVEMQKGKFRWPPAFRVEANMMNLENERNFSKTPRSTPDRGYCSTRSVKMAMGIDAKIAFSRHSGRLCLGANEIRQGRDFSGI